MCSECLELQPDPVKAGDRKLERDEEKYLSRLSSYSDRLTALCRTELLWWKIDTRWKISRMASPFAPHTPEPPCPLMAWGPHTPRQEASQPHTPWEELLWWKVDTRWKVSRMASQFAPHTPEPPCPLMAWGPHTPRQEPLQPHTPREELPWWKTAPPGRDAELLLLQARLARSGWS